MIHDIVAAELKCIPGLDSRSKDFRAIYQRERMKTLAKNPDEDAVKTLLRVMTEAKLSVKVSTRLLLEDFKKLIEPRLPIGFIMETLEDEIKKWSNLPSGDTILIFRPADYPSRNYGGDREVKDFLGWDGPTHAYALTAWQTPAGSFEFVLMTSYCTRNGGLADHTVVGGFRKVVKTPYKLEEELAHYDKFLKDLIAFLEGGEF